MFVIFMSVCLTSGMYIYMYICSNTLVHCSYCNPELIEWINVMPLADILWKQNLHQIILRSGSRHECIDFCMHA